MNAQHSNAQHHANKEELCGVWTSQVQNAAADQKRTREEARRLEQRTAEEN